MPCRVSLVLACVALCVCTGEIGEPVGRQGAGGAGPVACTDDAITPGRAPLRRLTRFEYNNTVRDLLGDTTEPGNALPSEELGNGFGNDADAQSVSSLLAESYSTVAESVATRATATPEALGRLAPCAASVTPDTEDACVRTIAERLLPGAYRRPLEPGELDEHLELLRAIRATSSFATSIAALIEAVLQSPDFLYKLEWGVPDPDGAELRRPSGHEMATRLSYFLWGTQPDEELLAAAASGELLDSAGVLAQATRLLDDPRARPVVRFFFDNLLPISNLSRLERDPVQYPDYSASIGALMREETQTFLEHVIFEGEGTWTEALTAPYTFVNEPLAAFYGIDGVTGDDFRQVDLDTSQRLGLLLQAGVLAGTIHSNTTNPVVRGSFIVRNLMCIDIPLPTGDILERVRPPDPYSGATARERFSAHSQDPVCSTCHRQMDPVGLALENFDAVGQWRDTENDVTIDASGGVPATGVTVDGPVELARAIAAAPETQACFVSRWLDFAYGRTVGEEDDCTRAQVEEAFRASGHDVRALLLALTQTDAFLYLPTSEEE